MRIFLFLFAVFIGASAAFAQPQDRTTAANSKKKKSFYWRGNPIWMAEAMLPN